MRSQPTQRLAVIKELHKLLLDGLDHYYILRFFFCKSLEAEVLLNSRSELLVYMINSGLLRVIGDIIVNETDPLAIVCCVLRSFLIHSFLLTWQRITHMLLSEIVEEMGLPSKDGEELTQEMIGNILKMIFVCTLLILLLFACRRKELRLLNVKELKH